MKYHIKKEFGPEQKQKIAKIKKLLKQKRFEHWESSQKTGVSKYKRKEESEPSLELVFHFDQQRACEFGMFEKDMRALR